jgi:hypothetical protein
MRYWAIAAAAVFVLAQPAVAAEAIDCAAPIAKAQEAISKTTGDLAGMNKTMAKSDLQEIHRLLSRARRLLGRAQKGCEPSQSPFDQAQAIGQAGAANAYATAADVLHFHFMQNPGSGGKEMRGMNEMKEKGEKTGTSGMPNK